jgi:hypothetical protein
MKEERLTTLIQQALKGAAQVPTSALLALAVSVGVGTGYLATDCYSGTCKLNSRPVPQAQADLFRLGGALVGVGLLTSAIGQRRKPELEPTQKLAPATLSSEPLHELAIEQQKHPHIMIVAKTGAGKSTLAQYLAAKCPGKRFAIAPHYDSTTDDWQCCHGIFTTGRNYGSEGDEPVAYADLVGGTVASPTAYQVISAIVTEMDARYKSPLPQTSHPVHNWLIDETPAIGRALDKAFGHLLAPVLFEARKVGLRLFVLTQTDNVETLKIKGQGKLRDQFTYIYAGDAAKARMRQLKRRQPKVAEGERWCVVDETVALVPQLADIQETVREATVVERFIAKAPDQPLTLPKPSALKDREPTELEWQALESAVVELQVENPNATVPQLASALGFKGEYYKRGKTIVASVQKRLNGVG